MVASHPSSVFLIFFFLVFHICSWCMPQCRTIYFVAVSSSQTFLHLSCNYWNSAGLQVISCFCFESADPLSLNGRCVGMIYICPSFVTVSTLCFVRDPSSTILGRMCFSCNHSCSEWWMSECASFILQAVFLLLFLQLWSAKMHPWSYW